MKKFKSAKQKQEFLDYQKWLDSHKSSMKKITAKSKVEPLTLSIGECTRNTNPNNLTIRSHGIVMDKDLTTKKSTQTYTGDKMIGIATLHKSVACPVFSTEDAIDISKMRRG